MDTTVCTLRCKMNYFNIFNFFHSFITKNYDNYTNPTIVLNSHRYPVFNDAAQF